ncbi:MAG TPA: hypothetical protein GXX67_12790 [Petrimonas sp.]|nr:hypothetical protein [Petrimonas sp.]
MTVEIKQNFILAGRKNRPATHSGYKGYKVYGLVMKPTTITIHSAYSRFNAKDLNAYCRSTGCADRPASWHFSVDEKEIWQTLPLSEPSWHAGDGVNGPGNLTSISIEMCDYAMLASPRNEKLYLQAEEHAAKLCAYLIKTVPTLKPFPDCMRQHWHWSGKNCPMWLRNRNGWQEFINKVHKYLTTSLYRVVCGSYTTWEAVDKQIEALKKAGFDSFTVGFNYNNTTYIRVVCGSYGNRDNADKQVSALKAKGFDSFIATYDGKDDPLPPREEPEPEPPKEDTVVYRVIINGKQVIALTGFEKAKEYALATYPNDEIILQNVDTNEKIKIQDAKPKLEPPKPDPVPKPEPPEPEPPEPDSKPDYKYKIVGEPEITLEQAKQWARNKGAHQRFIDIAEVYWKYGKITGIRPDVLYAQAAHETNFGKYTGVVSPEQNNWAGIKRANATGDKITDHESFATADDGVRGHFNHMSAYTGTFSVGDPHDRYYTVLSLPWAGTIEYVEELSTKWAPSSTYHTKIVQFLEEIKSTVVVPEPEPETEPVEPDPVIEPDPVEPEQEKLSFLDAFLKALTDLVELIIKLIKGEK